MRLIIVLLNIYLVIYVKITKHQVNHNYGKIL